MAKKLRHKIRLKPKQTPRKLFTDCWNSFWHIIFGVFAVKIRIIVPLFILYQLMDQEDHNVFIDLLEFVYGYIAGYIFMII
jgi:hypothetical protein